MFNDILDSCGIKAESLDKIRLGRGVVGKSSYVAAVAIIALASVALRISNEWILLGLGILIAGVFIFYFCGIRNFAEKNPSQALLEGAELVAWKQVELGAKGLLNPPQDQITSNPSSTAIPLSSPEGEEE